MLARAAGGLAGPAATTHGSSGVHGRACIRAVGGDIRTTHVVGTTLVGLLRHLQHSLEGLALVSLQGLLDVC